jgi:hypothetical protein
VGGCDERVLEVGAWMREGGWYVMMKTREEGGGGAVDDVLVVSRFSMNHSLSCSFRLDG